MAPMNYRAITWLAVLFLAACGSPLHPEEESRPTFVYADPDRMVPFPSDRFLDRDDGPRESTHESDTGYHIDVANFGATDPALAAFPGIAESLAGLDGFGTSADIAIGVTFGLTLPDLSDEEAALAWSVAEDTPIRLISIDPDDPDAGQPVPFLARYVTDGRTLLLRPWNPLRASGWYAVVIGPGLRDSIGRPFVAPSGFSERYADPAIVGGLQGEGYARLADVHAGPVVFALTFRTASITSRLQRLVEAERSMPPSPVTYTTRTPGAGHPDVATIVEGWFTARTYRNAEGKLEDTAVRERQLRFSLTLPMTSATVREPFDVVLAQHGLGDRRQAVLAQANAHAQAGMATLAIDAPYHGSRGPGDGQTQDFLEALEQVFGVWTDGSSLTFQGWKFRDIVRQQALDHLQVLRAVEAWEGDVARPTNEPGPDLRFEQTGYTGQSMGGMMGGITGTMLPELRRVLLNVPGGRLSEIFLNNGGAGGQTVSLIRPRWMTDGDTLRMISMMQSSLDPGDPINYVRHIGVEPFEGVPARPLLIQAVAADGTVPNSTTFDLVSAAQGALIGPHFDAVPLLPTKDVPPQGLSGDDLSLFSFFQTIRRGGEIVTAGHGNLWASETGLDQAIPFLKTGVVVMPPAP